MATGTARVRMICLGQNEPLRLVSMGPSRFRGGRRPNIAGEGCVYVELAVTLIELERMTAPTWI